MDRRENTPELPKGVHKKKGSEASLPHEVSVGICGIEKQDGFKRYQKKPLIIQARQLEIDTGIETLEGTMLGHKGDYEIIGIKGERYPCAKDIFEESYDEVEEDG